MDPDIEALLRPLKPVIIVNDKEPLRAFWYLPNNSYLINKATKDVRCDYIMKTEDGEDQSYIVVATLLRVCDLIGQISVHLDDDFKTQTGLDPVKSLRVAIGNTVVDMDLGLINEDLIACRDFDSLIIPLVSLPYLPTRLLIEVNPEYLALSSNRSWEREITVCLDEYYLNAPERAMVARGSGNLFGDPRYPIRQGFIPQPDVHPSTGTVSYLFAIFPFRAGSSKFLFRLQLAPSHHIYYDPQLTIISRPAGHRIEIHKAGFYIGSHKWAEDLKEITLSNPLPAMGFWPYHEISIGGESDGVDWNKYYAELTLTYENLEPQRLEQLHDQIYNNYSHLMPSYS